MTILKSSGTPALRAHSSTSSDGPMRRASAALVAHTTGTLTSPPTPHPRYQYGGPGYSYSAYTSCSAALRAALPCGHNSRPRHHAGLAWPIAERPPTGKHKSEERRGVATRPFIAASGSRHRACFPPRDRRTHTLGDQREEILLSPQHSKRSKSSIPIPHHLQTQPPLILHRR